MAKKKITQQQCWSDAETVRLLAWLDFTLRHPRISFQETIVGHLNDKYTFTKVEGKLVRLWKRYGPPVAPRDSKAYALQQIYSVGSKELNDGDNGLCEAVIEEIADALERLENGDLEDLGLNLRRQRRDDTRRESKGPSSSTRSNTIEAKESQQQIQMLNMGLSSRKDTGKNKSRPNIPSTPPRNAKKRKQRRATTLNLEKPGSSSPNDTQGIPARSNSQTTRQGDYRSVSTRFGTTIYDSDESPFSSAHRKSLDRIRPVRSKSIAQCSDNETLHDAEPLQQDRVEGQEVEEASRCICSDSDKSRKKKKWENWTLCSSCKVWQCMDCARYICEQCIGAVTSKRSPKDVDTQLSLRCVDCHSNGESLRGVVLQIEALQSTMNEKESEILEKGEDIKNLQRKVSALKCAQEKRDAHLNSPLEAEIAKLLEEKDRLQRKLGDRDALGVFTKLSTKSQSRHKAQEIIFKLHEVYSYRNKSLARMINLKISSRLHLNQNEDLEDLIRGTIGAGSGVDLTADQIDLAEKVMQASPEVFLESLLISAVQQWVFYSDFPRFDGVVSDTLRVYRENLALLGRLQHLNTNWRLMWKSRRSCSFEKFGSRHRYSSDLRVSVPQQNGSRRIKQIGQSTVYGARTTIPRGVRDNSNDMGRICDMAKQC
jgi:hypothetical protein